MGAGLTETSISPHQQAIGGLLVLVKSNRRRRSKLTMAILRARIWLAGENGISSAGFGGHRCRAR